MKKTIIEAILKALVSADVITEADVEEFSKKIVLERPADMSHGDYATNVAMVFAPRVKKSPKDVASAIAENLKKQIADGNLVDVSKVEVAGPGFINFHLKEEVIKRELDSIIKNKNEYGRGHLESGRKILFEYTDPNPFKVFHIGHLMANTIGESLVRLAESQGAEVRRFCYQGDVGRHVALTLWGVPLLKDTTFPSDDSSVTEKVAYFGKAYALGATEYKRLIDESIKNGEVDERGNPTSLAFLSAEKEVQSINRRVYDMTAGLPDTEGKDYADIKDLYDKGRKWSLEHFEELYKILGTKFDQYFYESSAAPLGKKIIEENTVPKGKAVFENSDGAIIFPGEKYDLHTRVFYTKHGLPTYEGKELGLAPQKYDAFPYDLGVTVTANEQADYFKVLFKVFELLFPQFADKNKYIGHGMMVLPTGKMSSRTGDVISGESLVAEMIEKALEKMQERDIPEGEKNKTAEEIAVSAIKYSILHQASGKNIIFDPEKSLSFEGDSGPYLQYAYVRAKSILAKAEKENIHSDTTLFTGADSSEPHTRLAMLLSRFPETVERAWLDLAGHHVANYLMELALAFNSFYATTAIVKKDDPLSPYRVALVKAFSIVMKNGLKVLGIEAPERM